MKVFIIILLAVTINATKRDVSKQGITEFDTSREQRLNSLNYDGSYDLTSCSTEYRFPVGNFQYCCQSAYKKDDPDSNPECNGEMINNDTPAECCLNSNFEPCPDKAPCHMNKGIDLAFIHVHPSNDQAYMIPNERIIPTYPLSEVFEQAGFDITEGYLMCCGVGIQSCHLLSKEDYQWHVWPGVDQIDVNYNPGGTVGIVVGDVPWLVGAQGFGSSQTAYFDRGENKWVKGPEYPDFAEAELFEQCTVILSDTQAVIAGGRSWANTCITEVYILDTVLKSISAYPGGNLNICRRLGAAFIYNAPNDERVILLAAGSSGALHEHREPEMSTIAKDGTYGNWIINEAMEILHHVAPTATIPVCHTKSGRHICFFTGAEDKSIQEFVPWQNPPWRVLAEETIARSGIYENGIFLVRV